MMNAAPLPRPRRARSCGLALVAALALAGASLGCEAYDPPPKTSLAQPAGGNWTRTTPLVLVFTEAIDPSSLVVSVWPGELDREGRLPPGAQPIVDACTLADSPCGSFAMRLDDAKERLTITVNDTFDDLEGEPLILAVHAGLRDLAGRTRKVEDWFDFQINPLCGSEPVTVELDTGVISLTANLQVLPIWLHLYVDLAIDKETGATVAVATFSRVREGLPANYNHPDGFEVALDPTGWAVTFTACLLEQPNGNLFLESDPFDVHIVVLGAIPVVLEGFRLQGTIRPGAAGGGRDTASGTLSTSGGSFGDPPNTVEAITSAWDGFSVRADELPEGLPRVCADDPCGGLAVAGGDCQIPSPWQPGAVCSGGEE